MQAGGQLAAINKFVLCLPDINTQNVMGKPKKPTDKTSTTFGEGIVFYPD